MTLSRSTSPLRWLGIAVLVIIADQIAKAFIVEHFQLNDSRTVTAFFNVVRAHNTGAAFSFLAAASGWQRWFFIGLGAAATVFITWLLSRHSTQRLFSLALALVLGGALGNVIDRLHYGYVVDFIQVHYASAYFPSFNVADSAITVGACLLILDELRRVKRPH